MTSKKDINNLKEIQPENDKDVIEAAKSIFDPLKKEEGEGNLPQPRAISIDEHKEAAKESLDYLLKTDSSFTSKYNALMDKVINSMIKSALTEQVELGSNKEDVETEFLAAAAQLSQLIKKSKFKI
jgi:DNA topoisomerase VI subunit B